MTRLISNYLNRYSPQYNTDSRQNKAKKAGKKLPTLRRIYQDFITWLSVNSDPQVSQVSDRSGNAYWRVYDPITEQSYSFDSEEAVRVWVEKRYSGVEQTCEQPC